MTGVVAATATGSAVPVMSITMPGRIPPAPRLAPCSSPVPTTTRVDGVRPMAPAGPGRIAPTTVAAASIDPSRSASSDVASSIRGDQACVVTS